MFKTYTQSQGGVQAAATKAEVILLRMTDHHESVYYHISDTNISPSPQEPSLSSFNTVLNAWAKRKSKTVLLGSLSRSNLISIIDAAAYLLLHNGRSEIEAARVVDDIGIDEENPPTNDHESLVLVLLVKKNKRENYHPSKNSTTKTTPTFMILYHRSNVYWNTSNCI